MDPNNLPSENTPPPVTTTDAAVAAVKSLMDQQASAAAKAQADSINIVDPTLPPPAAPAQTPTEKPAEPPATLPGATVEGALTPELLQRAAAVDISKAEAERLGAAATRRLVSNLERQQYQQPQYEAGPVQQPPQQPQGRKKIELPKTWKDANGEEHELEWNPGLVSALETLDERAARAEERAERAEQVLQQQQIAARDRQAQSMFKAFDAALAKATHLHDVLGSGDQFSCTPTERSARVRFLSRIEALQAADAQAGLPPQDFNEVFEQAEASLYPAKITLKATEKVNKELTERTRNAAGQFISRPSATTRANDMPKGDARAIAALEAKFREYGLNSY